MPFDLTESIAILDRTPAVVRSLLTGLPPAWTSGNEGPDTWSPFDIVGHLIDGDELDWIPRMRIILSQAPGRRFVPYDRLGYRRVNAGRQLEEQLDRFAALRAESLGTLRSSELSPARLAMTAEHPELGTVTLAQLIATWTVHDLGHIAQITRVMAKQYREAVGPWRAYLPVLDR